MVQNVLLFGYGRGCGVNSAVNLVKNTGIMPWDCFFCLHLASFAYPSLPHSVERNSPGTTATTEAESIKLSFLSVTEISVWAEITLGHLIWSGYFLLILGLSGQIQI